MATKYHTGSPDLTNTAAFSDTKGGAGGDPLPVDGDMLLSYGLTQIMTNGPAADLNQLDIHGQGGGLNDVLFNVANGSGPTMKLQGRFQKNQFGAGADGISRLRVFELSGARLILNAGTITLLDLSNATVGCTIDKDCDVTTIRAGRMPVLINGGGTGGDITEITADGNVTSERTILKSDIGGSLTMKGSANLGNGTSTNTATIRSKLMWESTGQVHNLIARQGVQLIGQAGEPVVFNTTPPVIYPGVSFFEGVEINTTASGAPVYVGQPDR